MNGEVTAQEDSKSRKSRTLMQAVLAFLLAVPVALAAIPIPSKYDAELAMALGVCAALVILIQRVQVALEDREVIPTFARPNLDRRPYGPLTDDDS